MEDILNYIFSSFIRISVVGIILFLAGMGFGLFRPFKKKLHNQIYRGFCYSLFFQWLIIATILSPHYGYAVMFKKVFSNGQQLYLLDEINSSSPGEGSTETYYRLYAVDINTGKQLYRKYLGNDADLLFLDGSQLFYRDKQTYTFINTADFSISKTYQPDKLPLDYPQLMPGVANTRYNNAFLEIDSKNGKKYYIEPLTGKLFDTIPDTKDTPGKAYSVESDKVEHCDSITQKRQLILQFKELENSVLKRIEMTQQTKATPPIDLIEPKFLDIFPKEQIVLVHSYETTDKESFILTAFDLSNECKRWQLKQSDIDKSDYEKNYSSMSIWIKQNQHFIFNSGGLLLCVEAHTGKIKWSEQQ